jgi:hypothetical protein
MSNLQGTNGLQVSAAVITVIALLTGSVVIPGSSTTSGQSATKAEAGDARDDSKESTASSSLPTVGERDPRRPFQEFWEVADPHAGEDFAKDLLQQQALIDLQFLIATVPDPIDSRFGYRFDGVIDDIQMAIETLEWNLDRYWLPWWPSGTQPGRRDNLKPIGGPDHHTEKDFEVKLPFLGDVTLSGRYDLSNKSDKVDRPGTKSSLHEHEPGVLIFRKSRDTKKGDTQTTQQMLIVFLVGERPTSGVHKAALGKAINIIDLFERTRTDPEFVSLKKVHFDIAGPYFTGSERSVSLVIKNWTDRRSRALGKSLVRESASALSSCRTLNGSPAVRLAQSLPSWSQIEWPGGRFGRPRLLLWDFKIRSGFSNRIHTDKFRRDSGDDKTTSAVRVEFDGTLHCFNQVLYGLFGYLKKLNGGHPLGKVALLTESDTEFGRIQIDPKLIKEYVGDTKITQMKFPFHISQVAIAYDQHRQTDDRKVPPPVLARSGSKLRIPFDETGSPRDIVPSLSPAMTAAADEFDTAKILETISLEDYRYVGIVATDTRDVIFLAGLIREYCPDVQLFSPTGDLLLGHPTYAPQLRGMIVASTYPMFSMAQRWDPPHRGDTQRHLFIHEADQGYYNATVSLLGQRIDKEEKPKNGNSHKRRSHYFDYLYDYGRPFDEMDNFAGKAPDHEAGSDRPPIWFGVIGQRGIWPVTYETAPRVSAVAGSEFIFQPRPGESGQPIEYPSPGAASDELSKWAQQFIALVPQFTWVWGTLVLLLCAAAWVTLFVHWQAALQRNEPGGFIDLFRSYVREDQSKKRGRSVRISQEFFAYGMLAALLIVHCYFVLRPCRLTLRHSPWRLFFFYFDHLPWGDQWNWCFGLIAIFLASASTVALVGAVAIRVYLAKPSQPSPETASARWGCAVLGSILFVVLLAALGNVGQGPDPAISPNRYVQPLTSILLFLAAFILSVISLRPVPTANSAATSVNAGTTTDQTHSQQDTTNRSGKLRVLVPLPLAVWLITLAIGVYLDPPIHYPSLLVRALDAWIVAMAAWTIGRLVAKAAPVARSEDEKRREVDEARKELLTAAEAGKPQAQAKVEAAEAILRQTRGKLTKSMAGTVVGIPALAGLCILAVEVIFTSPEEPYDSLLFLERAVNLGNGVSPEVPVFLLGLAAVAWLLCQLRRLDLIYRVSIDRLVDPTGDEVTLSLDTAPPCATAKTRKDRLIVLGGETRRLIAAFLLPIHTSPGSLMLLGLSFVFVLRLFERFVPTIDGLAYNRWMILSFSLLFVTVIVTLCRFLMVWARVRACLREIALLPMQRAFDEVPRSLSQAFGPYLSSLPPRLQTLEIPVRQWARVANAYVESGAHGEVIADDIAQGLFDERSKPPDSRQLKELAQAIRGLPKWDTEKWADPYQRPGDRILCKFEEECADPKKNAWLSTSEVRIGLRRSSAACLSVLMPYWASRSIHDGYGDPPTGNSHNGAHDQAADDAGGEPRHLHETDGDGVGNRRTMGGLALIQAMSTTTPLPKRGSASRAAVESTSTLVAVLPVTEELSLNSTSASRQITTQRGKWSEPAGRWFQQAEDLVALQMVDFLSECTIHLKNLVGYLAICPFLLMLAATSYPFQPQRFLVVVIWMLLIIVAASVVWVYIQMERDEILSRIAKTKPNKIEFSASFFGRITTILIPIAGVLLAQFPFGSDTIAQVLDPIIRVLK